MNGVIHTGSTHITYTNDQGRQMCTYEIVKCTNLKIVSIVINLRLVFQSRCSTININKYIYTYKLFRRSWKEKCKPYKWITHMIDALFCSKQVIYLLDRCIARYWWFFIYIPETKGHQFMLDFLEPVLRPWTRWSYKWVLPTLLDVF